MKFSQITLKHPGMSFAERQRENSYNFSTARGWSIELVGPAVVLEHPDRAAEGLPPTVLPFASVERADLLLEDDDANARTRPPSLGDSKRSAPVGAPAQGQA